MDTWFPLETDAGCRLKVSILVVAVLALYFLLVLDQYQNIQYLTALLLSTLSASHFLLVTLVPILGLP